MDYCRKTCHDCHRLLHLNNEDETAPDVTESHWFCPDCLEALELGEGLIEDSLCRLDAAATIRDFRKRFDWPGSGIDIVRSFKKAREKYLSKNQSR